MTYPPKNKDKDKEKEKEKDKDKSDTPAQAAATRANTRKGNSSVSTPEERQDIKDAKDGRKFLEKHLLLCPPGEPASNASIAYCLHQISEMSGVPKQTVNAIRAAAFMLEDIEELAINETVRSAFDSQITEFTSDMKMLTEDVNSKIDDHLKAALEQIATAAAKVAPQNSAPVGVGAPTSFAAVTYASTLINPPPNANPKLAAREGIRARQFLLAGIKESAFGQYDTQKLKTALGKIARDLGLKEGKIRSVLTQKDGNTLIEMDSDAAARWFTNPINKVEFCGMLGEGVSFKIRTFNVLAFNSPLNIDIRDDKHRREINETNGLEDNTIVAIRWAKPPTRRSPHQRSAHLVVSFANPDSANRAITGGLIICNKKCHVERIKREPIRCLKCQGWNHMARECPEMFNKCGSCGEKHNTSDCTQPRKTRCASCNTDDHASWSRECPTFLRKVEDFNARNPENVLPYFPTSDPWTWSSGATNTSQMASRSSTFKKASTAGKQREEGGEPGGSNLGTGTGMPARTQAPPYRNWMDSLDLNIGENTPANNTWWDDNAVPASTSTTKRPTQPANSTKTTSNSGRPGVTNLGSTPSSSSNHINAPQDPTPTNSPNA
jgi:hypothetical protein